MRFDFNRTPPSLIDFLQRDDASAGLLPTVERLLRLRDDLYAEMPAPLRATCEVASCNGDTVVLRVHSASAAAKLRQTLPRLRQTLVDRGWRVEGIRIRVKPRLRDDEPVRLAPPKRATMPAHGVAAFEDLGRRLEDSPANGPLRTAVEQLIGRRASRGVGG